VLARFGFLAQVANVIVLPNAEPWAPPVMQANNEIDTLVQQKLAESQQRRQMRAAGGPPGGGMQPTMQPVMQQPGGW